MDNLKQTVKCPTCGRGKAPDGVCTYCCARRKVVPELSPTEQEAVISEAKEYLAKKVNPASKFTFTHDTLMIFMQGIMTLAVEQAKRKNKDYASVVVNGGDDNESTGLANFYETSRRCGGTPLHAIAVHRLKHELSIEKMLRGEELESEPIMGRIIDAINYNVLALALYIETTQNTELLNKAADEMAALGVTLGGTDYKYGK